METDSEIMSRIKVALEKIRPYLIADGGDVSIESFSEQGILKVKFTGACKSCPFSFYTLKAGLEQTIQKDVPEVKEVIAV